MYHRQVGETAQLDKQEGKSFPPVTATAAPSRVTSGPKNALFPTRRQKEQEAAAHKKKDTTQSDTPAAASSPATRCGHSDTVYYSQVLLAAERNKKQRTRPPVPTAVAPSLATRSPHVASVTRRLREQQEADKEKFHAASGPTGRGPSSVVNDETDSESDRSWTGNLCKHCGQQPADCLGGLAPGLRICPLNSTRAARKAGTSRPSARS